MKKIIGAGFLVFGIILSSGIAFAQTADDYGTGLSASYCPDSR